MRRPKENMFVVMVAAFLSILLIMVARHHPPSRRKIKEIWHGRVYWEEKSNTTMLRSSEKNPATKPTGQVTKPVDSRNTGIWTKTANAREANFKHPLMSTDVDMDVVFFFGTRPEIIKLSPLYKQFPNSKAVFTGQHPDLVRPYIEKHGLHINVQFTDVFESGQTLVQLTSKLMLAADKLDTTQKTVWIVQGDTTTTYAIAYVAFLKNIPVAHIEAGLRTYDMKAPFPEEFNRQSVSLIAAANFAPTTKAAKALYAQGIPKSKVFVVGNTGIDAARIASDNLKPPKYVIDALNSWDKTLLFMTMHRRENQPRMNKYYDTVARVVGKRTDVKVLVPLHPNPLAKKAASNACEKYNTFVCVKPLDYEATQWVLHRAAIVITDSGGLQEESTWYSKPVLVLRRSTERTEAIDAGVSLLTYDFGTLESSLYKLLAPVSQLMKQMSQRAYPFGDGYAAEKIAKIMRTIDWDATDMKQVKPAEITDTQLKTTSESPKLELKAPDIETVNIPGNIKSIPHCGQMPIMPAIAAPPHHTCQQNQFHSQFGEDKFVHDKLLCNMQGAGTFLELGGRDGLLHSNSLYFERCLGWRGVMLEAKSGEYQQLCKNRPNAIGWNMAAGCAGVQDMQFKGFSNSGSSGLVDFMSEKHDKRWNHGAPTLTVKCGSIGEVLRLSGIEHLNFFSLDVEGAELMVMQTMDWSISVDVLIYEHINMKESNQDKMDVLLQKHMKFHSCQPSQTKCFNKVWVSEAIAESSKTCTEESDIETVNIPDNIYNAISQPSGKHIKSTQTTELKEPAQIRSLEDQRKTCVNIQKIPDIECKEIKNLGITQVTYDKRTEHISSAAGNYVKTQYEILKQEHSPDDFTNVLDIGANIGSFSMTAVSLGLNVHAFEPFPENTKRLRLSVFVNGAENYVTIHEHGLGFERSAPMLFTNPTNKVLKSDGIIVSGVEDPIIKEEWKNGGIFTPTTIVPLDQINNLPSEIFAVKIDVEGFESLVVNGGRSFFSSVRPRIIFMEFNKYLWLSRSSMNGWMSRTDVLIFFEQLGYIFYADSSYASGKKIQMSIDSINQRDRIDMVFVLAIKSTQTMELKKPGHKLTNTKRKCAMSPLRPTDRTGSVVHDMMFAWAYAEANGLDYKGPFGQRPDLQELNFAVAKFELPWSLQNTKNTDCKILDPKTYRNESILKSTWPSIRNSFKHRTLMNTCAVHIRRGDVSATYPMTGDYYRYRDDAYFLGLIKKHCGTLEVVIFSNSGLNLKFWETTGYTLKVSSTIAETWSGMLHSQVFITSPSSFSYTPALFAQGTIVYTPFWHKPMTDWTISSPSPSLPWKNVENSFTIVEKQCEGGVHGSVRPTVSTCVLSPSSTIMFQHMPHAAQTLFNCWSLFQHHATEHCNFFFADGLKTTPYANWMIKRMGCFVVEKLPSRCAYVSTYSAELRVEPGDTFSWFHTPKAAQRLREKAFLYLTSRIEQDSSVGIIRRKSTRKMLLPEAQVDKMTQVFFEDMNFDEQATFFYEHETILAAHGAAIIWAPFARPCSAIVQVYPQNYYPIGFYETLIQESGSVPITWWQGLTIGDEKNVKWVNAFKLHHDNRGNLRRQNIEISVNDWKKLRSAASDGRKNCPVLKEEAPVTLMSQPPCEEESQTVRECSSSDSKYQACSVKGTIDVILTVWKRDSLKSQLEDIAQQTKPVSHVWVVQNENHVEGVEHIVKDFKGTHPGIPTDIVNFGLNSKFHGRFYIAYFMSSAEYVSVWDDDIVVGNKWLEYSISESKKHGNALVGANGRIIHSISPLKQIRNKVGENDFVGHTWTMRRELLRYFLATPQYTYSTGEDMQISFALQKHGIISWLPTHDNDGRYVTNTKWSGNNVASYIKPETNKQRSWLACTLIYNGFKTIDCNDCDKNTAATCVKKF